MTKTDTDPMTCEARPPRETSPDAGEPVAGRERDRVDTDPMPPPVAVPSPREGGRVDTQPLRPGVTSAPTNSLVSPPSFAARSSPNATTTVAMPGAPARARDDLSDVYTSLIQTTARALGVDVNGRPEAPGRLKAPASEERRYFGPRAVPAKRNTGPDEQAVVVRNSVIEPMAQAGKTKDASGDEVANELHAQQTADTEVPGLPMRWRVGRIAGAILALALALGAVGAGNYAWRHRATGHARPIAAGALTREASDTPVSAATISDLPAPPAAAAIDAAPVARIEPVRMDRPKSVASSARAIAPGPAKPVASVRPNPDTSPADPTSTPEVMENMK